MSQIALFHIHLAADADRDLREILSYVATESGSTEIADRLLDRIVDRYSQLIRFPYLGRSRDDLGSGRRNLTVGEYVIVYRIVEYEVRILRIVHGRRDLPALFDL